MADITWVALSHSHSGNSTILGLNRTREGAKRRAETSINARDLAWTDTEKASHAEAWLNVSVIRHEIGE